MAIPLSTWESALDAFSASARPDSPSHFSVAGNRQAARFREWVNRYATGTILDVGCGLQEKPLYLADIDDARITGLDPLSASHPFAFVQGAVEDYDGGPFDTVICATSLDHVRNLTIAVHSMVRLGRRLIFWQTDDLAPQPAEQHTYGLSHADLVRLVAKPILAKDGDFFVFD